MSQEIPESTLRWRRPLAAAVATGLFSTGIVGCATSGNIPGSQAPNPTASASGEGHKPVTILDEQGNFVQAVSIDCGNDSTVQGLYAKIYSSQDASEPPIKEGFVNRKTTSSLGGDVIALLSYDKGNWVTLSVGCSSPHQGEHPDGKWDFSRTAPREALGKSSLRFLDCTSSDKSAPDTCHYAE